MDLPIKESVEEKSKIETIDKIREYINDLNPEKTLYGTLKFKGTIDKLPDEVTEHDMYIIGNKVYVGLNGEWIEEDIFSDVPKVEYIKDIPNDYISKQKILDIINSDEYMSAKELKEKIREVLC